MSEYISRIGNGSLVISSSGNVGIGTDDPSKKLHVNGDVRIIGHTVNEGWLQAAGSNFGVGNNSYGVFLGTYSGGTSISPGEIILSTQGKTGWDVGDGLGRIRFFLGDSSGVGVRDVAKIEAVSDFGNGSTTTTPSGALTFHTSPYNNQVTESVRIDSNGNVGIGTTSPDQLLHLCGSNANLRLDRNNTGYGASLEFNQQGNNKWTLKGGQTSGVWDFAIRSATGAERLTILQDGNVGIGTTSPNNPLHIDHSGSIAEQALFIKNSCNGCHAGIKFSDNAALNQNGIFYYDHVDTSSNGTANSFHFDSDQNTLAVILNQTGSNSGFYIGSGSSSVAIRGENNTYFNGGYVGIGTVTPSNQLHVVSADNVLSRFQSTDNRAEMHLEDNDTLAIFGAEAGLIYISSTSGASSGNFRISTTTGNASFGTAPETKTRLTIVPKTVEITSNSTNYCKAVYASALNFYDINSGVTDSGYRIAVDASAFVSDADFEGSLFDQYAIWARHGANVSAAGSSITRSIGVYIDSLTNANTTITDLYGLYQENSDAKNYFAGNVGINTDNPTQKLDVRGNDTNAVFRASSTAGVDAGIEIQGARNGTVDDETSYIHFTNYDDNASPVGVHNLGRIYGSMASTQGRDGKITIESFDGTSYQHGLTVDEEGKVGIGTTSPSEKLTVTGNISGSSLILTGDIYHCNTSNNPNRHISLHSSVTEVNKLAYNPSQSQLGGSAWLIGGGFTNYLYNWVGRGFFLSSSVTGGSSVSNVGGAISPVSTGDWATITQASAGTVTWELTSSGEFSNFADRGGYVPYVMMRTSEKPTNIKVEYKRVDTGAWVTFFDDTPSFSDSLTWANGTMDTTVGGGMSGIKYTLSMDGSGTAYVKDIGLTHQNFTPGGFLYGGTNATNTWSGTNRFKSTVYMDSCLRLNSTLNDINNSAGSSGQILSSTGTGTDWVNIEDIPNAISGSGTATYLPLWTNTNTLGDSRVFQTPSSIEILGASGQGYSRLLLKPDTGASLSLLELSHGPDPNNASVVVFGRGDSSYATINSLSRGTGVTKVINFFIDSDEKMRINTDGNVGIGTITPTLGKLQVAGRGYFGPIGTGDATTKALMDTYSVLKLKPHDSNSTNMTFAQVNGGNGIGIQVTNSTQTADWDIALNPYGGNVGINTTNPDYKLDVSGSGARIGGNFTTTTLYIQATDTTGAPAATNRIIMQGYEDRGQGIFYENISYTGEEWFSGIAYSSNFNSWQVGYDVSAGCAEYPAKSILTVKDSGNVGIGTTSPLYKLDVSGSIRSVTTPGGTSFRGVAESPNSDYTALRISNDTISDSANYGFSIKYMGTRDGNLNSLSIFSDNCTGTQVEAVSIMQDGNVGIGTTDPKQTLHVENSSVVQAQFNSLGGTSNIIVGTGSYNDAFSRIQFKTIKTGGSGEATSAIYQYGDIFSNNHLHIQSAQDIVFLSGSTETVRIKDGNVGIGTTGPNSRLDVRSTSAFTNGVAYVEQGLATNLPTLLVNQTVSGGNQNADQGLVVKAVGTSDGSGNTLHVYQRDGSTTGLVVKGSGNVGIGTISPDARLELSPSGTSLSGSTSKALIISNTNDTSWTADALTSYNATTGYDITDLSSLSFFARPTAGNILTFASETNNNGTIHRFVNLNSSATEPLHRWDFFQYDGSGTGSDNFKVPDKLFQIRVREGNSNVQKFTIKGNGNVGIGTTSPSEKLTVEGNISASGDLYLDGGIFDTNNSIGTSGQILSSTGTAVDWIDTTEIDGFVSGSGVAYQTALWTSANTLSSSRIYQNSSGRDAIGFFAPPGNENGVFEIGSLTDLDEHNIRIYSDNEIQFEMYTNYGIGNAGISDTVWFSNPNAFGVQYNGPAGTAYPFYFDDAGDGNPTTCNKLCFNVAGFFINAMTIQGDGNVGIGTSSPDALLELSSSTKQSLLNVNEGYLYVSGSGNVGIGNTSPSEELHVSGDILVDSNSSFYTDTSNCTRYSDTIGRGGVSLNSYNFNGGNGGPNIQVSNCGSCGWANVYINKFGLNSNISNSGNRYFALYSNGSRRWDININTGNDLGIVNVVSGGNLLLDPDGNGNVGIGTASPATKLDIYGEQYSSNYPSMLRVIDNVTAFDTDNNGGGISFGGRHTSGGVIGFLAGIQGVKENNTSGNYGGALRFLIRENGSSLFTEKMRIDRSGNVGIGTTIPTALLELSSSTAQSLLNVNEGYLYVSGSGNVGIGTDSPNYKLEVDGTTDFGNTTTYDNAAAGLISWNSGTKFKIRGQSGHALSLGANGTEDYVWIDTDGNVGIGTTSPTQKLEVAGNIRLQPTSGTPYIQITDTGLVNSYIKLLDGTQVLAIGDDGTDEMFSISMDSEFVGVGTLTASANLHVEGSGSTLFKVDGYNGTLFSVDDDLSDSLLSANNASGLPVFEVFADDTIIGGRYNQNDFYLEGTSGNVGIGTSSPTEKLHLSGSVRVQSGDIEMSTYPLVPGLDFTTLIMCGNGTYLARLQATQQNSRVGGELKLGNGISCYATLSGHSGSNADGGCLLLRNADLQTTHNLTNTDSCLVADGQSNMGIGASPGGDGRLHVDAGGTGNNFLEAANACGEATTSTTGKNFKGWLGIHLNSSVGSPAFSDGDYFIAVYQ